MLQAALSVQAAMAWKEKKLNGRLEFETCSANSVPDTLWSSGNS